MYVPFKTKKERDKYGAEVNILTKVKDMQFLEDGESMTRSMVADYFEVKDYEIKTLVKIYKRELQENGLEVLTGKGFKWYVHPLHSFILLYKRPISY